MCCLIFVVPPLVHAGVVGATSRYVINAVKSIKGGASVEATSTATGARHMIRHGVSAEALGKGIGAGIIQFGVAAGLGLAFEALTGLALDAVDWVMDPANNRIKYTDKTPVQVGNFHVNYDFHASTPQKSCDLWASSKGFASMPVRIYDGMYRCMYPSGSYGPIVNGDYTGVETPDAKYLSLDKLAEKTIQLADSGNALAKSDIVDFVKKQAESGALDKELDASTDITKPDDETSQCSAGYVKNGEGKCIKKDSEQTTCPAGTVKVGEKCIKELDPDDSTQCGDCCVELIAILAEMAKMNEKFYEKSLDNDALMLYQLKQLNTEVSDISNNVNSLLDEAKLTNKTLKEINDNQEIHFNDLKTKLDDFKKAIQDDNAEIKQKLDDVLNEAKKTNEKLDKVNEKLDKVNENLEKMQKCNETEFNKKVCAFIDWFQDEPTQPTDEKPTIKDIEAQNSNKIDMSGSCPAPYQINFSVFGHSQNNSISYQPLCDALEMLKPIFVGAGALSSMFILMGYSRPNSTGVNN